MVLANLQRSRLSLLILLFPAASLVADDALPHWVWSHDTCNQRFPSGSCRLERTFSVEQPIRAAKLRMAADFCSATVEINGQGVVSVLPFCPAVDVDAAAALKSGENRIAISAASSELVSPA